MAVMNKTDSAWTMEDSGAVLILELKDPKAKKRSWITYPRAERGINKLPNNDLELAFPNQVVRVSHSKFNEKRAGPSLRASLSNTPIYSPVALGIQLLV